jgi:hypothetical protein
MKSAGSLRGFAAWVVAGGLLAFSLVSWLGLLLLPVALVACWLAARGTRSTLELLGALSGAGLLCLGIAFGARDHSPCPPGGSLTVPPGETSVSCGGFDPVPWLVAGLALVVAGALAYGIARRVHRSRAAR